MTTIDEVIARLDATVDGAMRDGDRLGYFAALYRRVTKAVKAGLTSGRFADPVSLERLDVVFASRYFDALDAYRAGRACSRCWRIAFDAAPNPVPLVLQQLLLGMNAHINFDLGVATAEVNPLERDFNEINATLAEQVASVEAALGEVSPLLGLLENIDLRTSTRIINFNLGKARDLSWLSSQRLQMTPPLLLGPAKDGLDVAASSLALAIANPLPPLALKLAPIRAAEENDVRKVLAIVAS